MTHSLVSVAVRRFRVAVGGERRASGPAVLLVPQLLVLEELQPRRACSRPEQRRQRRRLRARPSRRKREYDCLLP